MKKIILRKAEGEGPRARRIGYKINYEYELNTPQYEAVMHNNGAALIIAGAGTGKTRTLIYRVARMIEDGIPPEALLLLTFTRKAASEMLRRASSLLDGRCEKVSGGTFHSFAMLVLRQYSKLIGYDSSFNILDQSDSEDTINLIRNRVRAEKSKRRFPHKDTLYKIQSMAVNKRLSVEEIVQKEYPLFVEELETILKIITEYDSYKRRYNLMDYDDLLLNLLNLLKNNNEVRKEINSRYRYSMIDEYQDTNRLQHEIVLQLAGPMENAVAVGDDAQSIYSFRGADFQNIMFYPESFSDCKIYKIEENYRSTQPVLDLTNKIIDGAIYKYEKKLFTRRVEGSLPKIIMASDERQQSEFIVQQVLEFREEGIPLEDMAVLFRSSFLSFDLEIELNKANIPYMKFGGMKFIETAHIKDLIAYLKIIFNPRDAISWQRVLLLLDGVGPRTSTRFIDMIAEGSKYRDLASVEKGGKGSESIKGLIKIIDELSNRKSGVGDKASLLAEYYQPILKGKYDDWQKRWRDIEMFIAIAERYNSLRDFLNDMALEPPIESLAGLEAESKENEFLTLSTIHSAKGLEWKVVFLIWALEGRFPSAKSADSIDSLEEERRLFYVACTRAKDDLFISYPANIYDMASGFILSEPSRFLRDIDDTLADKYILSGEEEDTTNN